MQLGISSCCSMSYCLIYFKLLDIVVFVLNLSIFVNENWNCSFILRWSLFRYFVVVAKLLLDTSSLQMVPRASQDFEYSLMLFSLFQMTMLRCQTPGCPQNKESMARISTTQAAMKHQINYGKLLNRIPFVLIGRFYKSGTILISLIYIYKQEN